MMEVRKTVSGRSPKMDKSLSSYRSLTNVHRLAEVWHRVEARQNSSNGPKSGVRRESGEGHKSGVW
ncbi:hypothetical protein KFK09_008888 [Dendrobium nobile]|uniref:Uncharacterized protein n=1 Tax=Dendrobium nobile TaxID=94219 RepID=A0A8T3BQV0_DENNO|nr:hypothetical protein KFK09_008888 [Dendrobium nobile]